MTNKQKRKDSLLTGLSTPESGTRRAIHLLRHIVAKRALSFAELEALTSFPKASLHRLLNELKVENIVHFDDQKNKWTAGFALMELGIRAWSSNDIRSISHTYLQNLNQITGETIQLSILLNTRVLLIDQVKSQHGLGYCVSLGHSEPAHCCAAGKALLAFEKPDSLDRYFKLTTLDKITPYTISHKLNLITQLKCIKGGSVASGIEESHLGLRDYAAPITDDSGSAVAAISIVIPEARVDSGHLDNWLDELASATRELSHLMLLHNH